MVLSGEVKTQAEAAELFDISQPAVSQAIRVISETSHEEKLLIPSHITGNSSQADFRKLSPAGQEQVRQGEPLNRVAIAEGVRNRLSPLQQAQKAFRRLTKEDQNAFGLWLNEQPR